MKLRLFAIRDTSTNELVPDTWFSSKDAAKRARDELNQDGSGRYVVTLGPDHRKRQ